MVKVLVNGGLFEISKVEEIVEKRVPFNGTNIRLVQIAKDSKQAVSGLHFQVKNTECNVFAIGEFTIGNLPTAKVKEIMKQLLSDGYYDFSDCDFQPMMFVEKYKFDEGKSKPYFCQGSLIQFYASNDVFNCPLNINKVITQLVEDINDVANDASYYIGALIVSKQGNKYEVVDGQQRLTSLYLLLNCLGVDVKKTLTFACRERSNYTLRNITELLGDERDKFEADRLESGIVRGIHILNELLNKDDFDNWQWRCPYVTKRIKLNTTTTKSDVIQYLEELYALTMAFEKEMLEALGE